MSLFTKHHQQQQQQLQQCDSANNNNNNSDSAVLQNIMRYITPKHNPTNVKNYFHYVFSTLSTTNTTNTSNTNSNTAKIDFLTFYNYSSLSIFISRKLFTCLNAHNDDDRISLNVLLDNYYNFYFGSIRTKVIMTFDLLNMNNDNFIYKDDVALFITHLHLMSLHTKPTAIAAEIVDAFFGNDKKLSIKQYVQRIQYENSDLFLLIQCVMITTFMNYVASDYNNPFFKKGDVIDGEYMCMVDPTVKLIDYLYTQYGLEFHNEKEKEYEYEVDLDILDLETFEQDIKMAFNFNGSGCGGSNANYGDKLFSSFSVSVMQSSQNSPKANMKVLRTESSSDSTSALSDDYYNCSFLNSSHSNGNSNSNSNNNVYSSSNYLGVREHKKRGTSLSNHSHNHKKTSSRHGKAGVGVHNKTMNVVPFKSKRVHCVMSRCCSSSSTNNTNNNNNSNSNTSSETTTTTTNIYLQIYDKDICLLSHKDKSLITLIPIRANYIFITKPKSSKYFKTTSLTLISTIQNTKREYHLTFNTKHSLDLIVNHIETLTHHRSFMHYYTVLNQIDNGVFNGFSKPNRKHCVIKEVIKDYTSHEDLRLAYSERDITQLLQIYNYDGINQIYDIIETADKIYIVEEQIEKGNLNNVLSCYSHLICFKSVYNMIMQLINTVHFIHSLGIVHRDLKMENVLVKFTHKGVETKVIDFGISNIISKNETLTAKYGTFNNLPPEIIKGEEYFHNIDIWNLGIVIYNLLYKQHPFPLKKIMELNKAITKGDVVYPQNISWNVNNNNQQERTKVDVVVEVMKKCLIKNQYLRPDAIELMEYVEGN